MATREEILKQILDLRKRKKELKNPNRKAGVERRIDLLQRRLKGKKLNVDTSDVTLPKSKSGVSRLRMRKRAERDELIPKGATGPQPRGSDAPILAPRPKLKKPTPKKQAPPAPAMMFDSNLQQKTPDVGAMSQGIEKVKKAKKKSVGGGRGTMAGNKGFETMKEYFADDMSGRKSRVKTPFGTITIDSSDKGMAFEEYDAKFGGKAMPKVSKQKSRKGKRVAIRGRRAEMKGS